MKKISNKLSFLLFAGLLQLTPGFILAQDAKVNAGGGVTMYKPGDTDGNAILNIILNVTTWVLGFAGALATLFIIYGGILYMTASGNDKRADQAKKTLTYAVIGLIIILLAYVIVTLSGTLVNGALKGTTGTK